VVLIAELYCTTHYQEGKENQKHQKKASQLFLHLPSKFQAKNGVPNMFEVLCSVCFSC